MRTRFLWTLTACVVLGFILALVVAYLISRPIGHLVRATQLLRSGDLSARARVFSDDETGRLATAFNDMAESLEQSTAQLKEDERIKEQLVHQVVAGQEEERKRLARELHDELGQSLSILAMQAKSLASGRNPEPGPVRKQIADGIKRLVVETKRMAFDLRPSVLDDYGLSVALRRYIQEVAHSSGLRFDFATTPGDDQLPRFPATLEITLYRIAQEAVTNIVRHANATTVVIVLVSSSDEVTLCVEDDGEGFDPQAQSEKLKTSLGLAGMRERATLLGGTLAVETSQGSGTTVTARIPMTGA